MEFKHETNRIYFDDGTGKTIAEVTFPDINQNSVEINHTFVDDSLRGQGVAGKLMEELAKRLRAEGKTAVLTCSYAISWFEKNKGNEDLISR
jgi:predicted GNAT family acetyltransferase